MKYSQETYEKATNALEALKPAVTENEKLTVDFIVAAIREKQEREKGCEYCNDPDTEYGVISFPRTESGEIDINQVEAVEACCCPMCGRELKEAQDERND